MKNEYISSNKNQQFFSFSLGLQNATAISAILSSIEMLNFDFLFLFSFVLITFYGYAFSI